MIGTHKSAPKAASQAAPGGLPLVPTLRVLPAGKAVLLRAKRVDPRPRNVLGQFVKHSTKPLPGSNELQSILASDPLGTDGHAADAFAYAIGVDMAREGGDRVAVYTRNGMDSLRRFDLAHPPIHNRYYAIWLVGTLLGMAGVAWVVHHFGL